MGFFYSDAVKKKKKGKKADMPVELMHQLGCKACPRNNDTSLVHPKIKPTGSGEDSCEVYILGEAPGENEDKRGRQFIGKSGELLRSTLPKKWNKRIRWNNTIRCRPPNNRDPLPQEVECCRPLQEQDIAASKPKVVVLVGRVPTVWLVPETSQGIHAWRGRLFPANIGGHVCWAYPILHPAGVLRNDRGKHKSEEHKVFERDLKTLFKMLPDLPDAEVFSGDYMSAIQWPTRGDLKAFKQLRKTLQAMAREKLCSVDLETRRLRPYYKDADILTCSVTTRKHGTYAFPVGWPDFWKTPELQERVRKLLGWFIRNSGRKVCHNTKFEQEWFAFHYGMDAILKTKWADTMAQGYTLDSRKGMLNLDVMIRLHFGFDLKALSPDVDRKRIWNCRLEDVLPYNGLDTKWTLELYHVLRKRVSREKLTRVVAERVRTGATIVGAMLVGVPVHEPSAKRLTRTLTRRIDAKLAEARETRAHKRFVKRFGRDPNFDSHPDMEKLFGEIMKVDECRTPSGGITTKDDILKGLNPKRYPIAPIIVDVRSLGTIKSTFLDPLSRVVYPDKRLHTNYGHLFTTSGRLNSEDPNLQNWPKQSEWKKIRGVIRDLEGNLWVISFDYGQIEARCIAMASQDPTFVQMLWDQYDVHMEWAQRIYDEWKGCLKAMGITEKWNDGGAKKYRQEVKNKWVFPLFFGSQEYSVQNNLNLPSGVTSYLYNEFWSVFEGIKSWQEELINDYNKKGYVETLTGRRRYAPCSYNEQINHPIQGTASDIVVAASTRLQDSGIQFNLNVHDDLTFLMENDANKIRAIAKEMCRPVHDFINVPLVIEVEAGPNWYKQKPVGVFASDRDFNFH